MEDCIELVSGVPALGGVVAWGHEQALSSRLASPPIVGGETDSFLLGEIWKREMLGHLDDDNVFAPLRASFQGCLALIARRRK